MRKTIALGQEGTVGGSHPDLTLVNADQKMCLLSLFSVCIVAGMMKLGMYTYVALWSENATRGVKGRF